MDNIGEITVRKVLTNLDGKDDENLVVFEENKDCVNLQDFNVLAMRLYMYSFQPNEYYKNPFKSIRIEMNFITKEDKVYRMSVNVNTFKWILDQIIKDQSESWVEADRKYDSYLEENEKIFLWTRVNQCISQLSVYSIHASRHFNIDLDCADKYSFLDYEERIKFILSLNPNECLDDKIESIYIFVLSDHILTNIKLNRKEDESTDDWKIFQSLDSMDKLLYLKETLSDEKFKEDLKNKLDGIAIILKFKQSDIDEQEKFIFKLAGDE